MSAGDLLWSAVDIVASPIGSIDKYITQGAIAKTVKEQMMQSPVARLGKAIGDNNPTARAKAQVLRAAMEDVGATPENLMIGGVELALPIEAVGVAATKGASMATKAVKAATEARKVGLTGDALKLIANPGAATKFIDIGGDIARAAPDVIKTLANTGNKARVTLTDGGKALDAATAAAHWDDIVKVARASQTNEAIKAAKTVEAYRTAAAQAANLKRIASANAKIISNAEAARMIRKAGSEAKAINELTKAVGTVKRGGVAAQTYGKIQEVVGSTVKTARSVTPYVITGAAGATGAAALTGLYLLSGNVSVEKNQPTPDQSELEKRISALEKGGNIPGPTIDSDVPDIPTTDWDKIMKDLMGDTSGSGFDLGPLGDFNEYPLGSTPDSDVLSDDYGYLDTTGMPLIDAPLEVINGGLDSIGVDSDFAEGLREATGMGPIMGVVALAIGGVVTYVVADKTGFIDAIKNFEIGDVVSSDSGSVIW